MSFWIRYKRSTPFPDIQPNTLGDFSPVFNLCFKAMRMELLASSSRLSLTITSKNVQFGSSIPSLQISNSNRYSSRRIEICCSFFLWVSILSLQYGDFYNAYTHLQTLFLFLLFLISTTIFTCSSKVSESICTVVFMDCSNVDLFEVTDVFVDFSGIVSTTFEKISCRTT